MHGKADVGGVGAHLDREADLCNQVPRIRANNGATQHSFVRLVPQQLREAFGPTQRQRPATGGPRYLGLLVVDPLLFCLGLCESLPGHFMIRVCD